jgi:hypothetical protein
MCVASSVLTITANFLYLSIWLQIHINRLLAMGFACCLFLFRSDRCHHSVEVNTEMDRLTHDVLRCESWMETKRRTINIEEKSMACSVLSIVLWREG